MSLPVALLCLSLGGCAAYRAPYVLPPPQEIETYVKEYKVCPGFSGVEVTLGLPIMKWVPVVGPYLSEMFQFRAGVRQDVLVPVMEESSYEHEARIAAAARAAALRPGVRFFPDGVRVEAGRPWLCPR